MKAWINFKELRQKLDFEQVLKYYNVEVKRKGDQHHGICPLPGHAGDKQSASFSANLVRGIFQCFSCGAKGNVLEFVALMEKADPSDGKAFRIVAMKLHQQFCSTKVEPKAKAPTRPDKKQDDLPLLNPPTVVNAPLDFELKGLDNKHPYFQGRGFTQEIVEQFGLGVTSRGTLKGRIAIPLHNHAGKLVGYAGRIVDEKEISGSNPKYWFPAKREHEGTVYEFQKSLFLYNGFRITARVRDCIVVKGFTAVWWLSQCGLPHVVSTMGPECSEKQAELIVARVKSAGRVWIMTTGNDNAAELYTACVMLRLAPHRPVRWVKLHDVNSATVLSAEQLKKCFK